MIRSGDFVADYIKPKDGEELDPKAIQPNGVDLSIDKLYAHASKGVLTDDDYLKPEREEMGTEDGFYELKRGAYVAEYGEIVEIPENHVGIIYPRSRLMRCGSMLFSAVWDSGYRGKGEGGLWIEEPMKIEDGMRIGQMVFYRTEELESHYSGSHQGENL